ncbi:MAG: helix-turn-helix transcriptional regulator [Oscillospiraceae bacterium]|nr:helix-turn-helix transcriptional regulator [Oscillospiraceae bacterium]
MDISFSEVFKRLRREHEITQEQAAEIFDVSPQAVSRWECGQTCPDIALLPVIAEYFDVSIETLLGVEIEKRKALHKKYMDDIDAAMKAGKAEECADIARAGLRDFPKSYELMNALMSALYVLDDDTGDTDEEDAPEIIKLGETILSGCTDDAIRMQVKSRLGAYYCDRLGDTDKAAEIYGTLPGEIFSREEQMYRVLSGEDRVNYLRKRICSITGSLQWNIWRLMKNGTELDRDDGKEVFSPEERIKYMKVIEDIESLIFDEEDHGLFYRTVPMEYFSLIIPDLISLDRLDDALEYSEKACTYLERFCDLPDTYVYTSPLVDGIAVEKSNDTADKLSIAQMIYEDMLGMDVYSVFDGDERFDKVKQRIKDLY